MAVSMIELKHDLSGTREYIDSLKSARDAAFSENYQRSRDPYSIRAS